MPRGVFNWTFDDVARFLRDRKFRLNHVEGSHYYYVGSTGGKARQVAIPFHGQKTLKPRTMKGIIAQSGIPQNEWTEKRPR